ncbi:7TM protein involved in diverse intracellular signaling [Aquimarina sp. MAR_2010_214]|uniref:sensor histidine kinase n=1 Tax=Aquimarina sp. MAR_2010_214 TaxID=1250026 RepID=UPI000C7022D7|nr:histidine kinase [Aquimarina sp. MAR_2010_214]PKV48906.1 7TM protein involved in diverse intracellular signaling [Aquimarina sp. MAR_2010_214]
MPKNLLYVISVLIVSSVYYCSLSAQNNLDKSTIQIPFEVYKTTNDTISIHDIIKSDTLFRSSKYFTKKTSPKDIYWIKIDLTKELKVLETDSLWFLKSCNYGHASMFCIENNTLVEKKFGLFDGSEKMNSIFYIAKIPFEQRSLIKNRFIYLKIRRLRYSDRVTNWKFHYASQTINQSAQNYYSQKNIKIPIRKYVFSGVCLVMFILTLAFFITSRNIEFLFYSLYIFCLFIYLNGTLLIANNIIFDNYSIITYWFFQIAQVLINLCYVYFVSFYLATKKDYPTLNRIIKWIIYTLITIIILDSLFLYFNYFTGAIYIMNIQRFVMTLFGIGGMIYLLLTAKNRLAYFIVAGSFLFMIGTLGFFFFKTSIYMMAGATLEIIIFALGLAYKIHQEHKEKLLFEKESFINNCKALRAQINPHFIFNSLGSIQHLIVFEKKEAALKYLKKFSLLMRNLLENSIETNILLSDEINLLHQYLELETLRFDTSFEYTIHVDDVLNTDAEEVPMLIIQPFVENAILYGLLNKNGGSKKLNICFRKEKKYIICEVDDNGIGRSAAKNINSSLKKTTKSRGLELTEKRLQRFHKSEEKNIEIIDKIDTYGASIGTRVIIKIQTE